MIESFTTRSGPRIRYLDNAPDDPVGLPILLSPGFTDEADEYVTMLEALTPRRVLVVEVRGRGGSEAPPTGYTAADHADDLRGVLDAAGVDRYHLMTFSRGTTWGLDLVLGEPGRAASVSIGDYWAREYALGPGVVDQVLDGRFRGRPMRDRIQHHVVRSLFAASVDRDLHEPLASSGLPVLVATGTESGRLLDKDAIGEYRTRVPEAEIVTIDGAGHDLFRPDRLAYPRAVVAFIARRTGE